MFDEQQTMSAIEVHGKRSKLEAEGHRDKATQARADAKAYADQHVGEAMRPHRERILADGEAKARGHEVKAKRAEEHAKTADHGYLLHGPEEQRDPVYAMGHQEMISGAGRHGLLRSEPI